MMSASRIAAKVGLGCERSHHLIAANSITAPPATPKASNFAKAMMNRSVDRKNARPRITPQ
jgi:hypothetical protein